MRLPDGTEFGECPRCHAFCELAFDSEKPDLDLRVDVLKTCECGFIGSLSEAEVEVLLAAAASEKEAREKGDEDEQVDEDG